MAGIAKRSNAMPTRMIPFNLSHIQEYDLQISEREVVTSRIIVVACRFYTADDQESKIDAKRQKATAKKKFDLAFCPKNYRIHLKSEHPIRWEEYQSLSTESKMTYFGIDVPFVNTNLSHIDKYTYHVIYNIEKCIVEFIIREM